MLVLSPLAGLLPALPANAVGLVSPGDVLFADLTGNFGVSAYRPASGTTITVNSGGLIPRPAGIAVESQNSILVTNVESTGRLVRINLATNTQALVSEAGLLGSNPDGVTMGSNGVAYVTSLQGARIVEVNLTTGAQRLVTAGGFLEGPIFVAVLNSNYLITTGPANGIIEVNIANGVQRKISADGLLITPHGLAILPDGKILVADYENGSLVRVDAVTGQQTLVASGIPGAWGLSLDGRGFAYVTRYVSGTNPLVKVDLATGQKTNILTSSSALAFGTQVYFPSFDPPPAPPGAPSSFVASDDSPDGVILHWDPPPGQDGYRIYREGSAIAILPPSDTSYVDIPPVGTHTYCIEAFNFGGVSPMSCDEGRRRPFVAEPTLHYVRDVPADQGGRIALAWKASEYDSRITHAITGYRVWRRLPETSMALRSDDRATANSAMASRPRSNRGLIEYWEPILTLPSGFREGYGAVVETTRDSIADSNPWTAFFISALTADPVIFYDSAIDSGYSVDNLAPPVPPSLTESFHSTGEVRLSWRTPAASDLGRYDIYRGSDRVLDLSRDVFLGSTLDTAFADPQGGFYYYKVVALDVHGNRSAPATLSPLDIPTPAWILAAASEWNEGTLSIVVHLVTDRPWNRATVFRSEDPDFENAAVVAEDLLPEKAGRFRYVERRRFEARSWWYWMRITDGSGRLAMAGPIIVEPSAALASTVVFDAWPNPFVHSADVAFVVGTEGNGAGLPVRARIVDATGHRVRDLDLGTLPPGRHVLRWDGLNTRGVRSGAGVYHMALRVGKITAIRRMVRLR